jgi:hypothetical protein
MGEEVDEELAAIGVSRGIKWASKELAEIGTSIGEESAS